MTPERKQQIEKRLWDYPEVKARYRFLTETEAELADSLTADLPTDSVKSPTLSDMPHGSEVSNPTLGLVMRREEIVARRIREQFEQTEELQKELARLQSALVDMVELWAELDPVERHLIAWMYFPSQSKDHPPSYKDISDMFAEYRRTRFAETVYPTNRNLVGDAVQHLLEKIDRIWSLPPIKC